MFPRGTAVCSNRRRRPPRRTPGESAGLISPSHALPMVPSKQAQPDCMATCNQVGPKDAEEHHAVARPDEFVTHRLLHLLWTACTEAAAVCRTMPGGQS